MSEAVRLADQIRRAFEGGSWHGDALFEILVEVDAKTAAARPVKNAHSIWELVLHIRAWDEVVLRRMGGAQVTLTDEENFPPVKDISSTAWQKTLEAARGMHADLVKAVADFTDSRLLEQVPGEGQHYTFFYMISGVAQHELYHAGQIALLKKVS